MTTRLYDIFFTVPSPTYGTHVDRISLRASNKRLAVELLVLYYKIVSSSTSVISYDKHANTFFMFLKIEKFKCYKTLINFIVIVGIFFLQHIVTSCKEINLVSLCIVYFTKRLLLLPLKSTVTI